MRLIDVLLRPEVMVFEPLWTVIPGNKAICRCCGRCSRTIPYLLDTDFEVSEHLAKTGYAIKPISGRCGSNIHLVSGNDRLLDKTSGKCVDKKKISSNFGACQTSQENILRYVPLPSVVIMAAPVYAVTNLW
ncbi:glutathionylspermidine synthase family protein [Escherichia coli]